MKYIVTLIVLITSFFGFTQKIENGVINYSLLESEIVKQVNSHRKEFGVDSLPTSKVVNQEITSKNALLNSKSDSGFHPNYDRTNKVVNEKIYKEICSIEGISSLTPEILDMCSYGEIISVVEGVQPTYQDFASACIKGWVNSPKHKKIMETNFTNVNGFEGLISCSVKKSITGKYYVVVNFINLTYLVL
jgi:hypothetical protein